MNWFWKLPAWKLDEEFFTILTKEHVVVGIVLGILFLLILIAWFFNPACICGRCCKEK